MTATTTDKPLTRGAASDQLLPQEIDHSCRAPLLYLFTAGMAWLVFSLVVGILASIKMHAPGMLADYAALTYGRVAAVASNAFYYGFASQLAIGIALWLFARLSRTLLVLPRCAFVATILWNLGLTLGIIALFAGDMSQHRLYEMPAWTSLIFFAAFVIYGVSGILTFNARAEREVYPSGWFLIASFFTLPWILSAAHLLLGRYTVRGVVEPPMAIWYANNFVWLWLAPVALATIFYFVPRFSNQPLYSRGLAVFGFWLYLLFASGLGFQHMPGLPNWMPVLSRVLSVLVLLPVAVFAWNWYVTWVGHNRAKKQREPASKYLVFAAFAFVSAMVVNAIVAQPGPDETVGLTVFHLGSAAWVNYGFLSMAFFAAMLHILPRLTEIDWPNPKLNSVHFSLSVIGLILVAGAFAIAGMAQGAAINSPSVPFNQTVKRVVPFIGINSIGLLLLLAGQAALLGNIFSMLKTCMLNCCGCNKEAVR